MLTRAVPLLCLLTLASPLPLAAGFVPAPGAARQSTTVTEAELARLETMGDDIARRVSTLKKTDPGLASDVERSLNSLREEVTYFKVKLRKEGGVTRADYLDLQARFEALRVKAANENVHAQPVANGDPMHARGTVPAGTRMQILLQTPVNSGMSKLDQRFTAAIIQDVAVNGDVLLPAGTTVRGFVGSVHAMDIADRQGRVTLSFDEIVLGEDHLRLRASVEQVLDSVLGDPGASNGLPTGVGSGIGGHVMASVFVGPSGTIASVESTDVDLHTGVVLTIRLDSPVAISR